MRKYNLLIFARFMSLSVLGTVSLGSVSLGSVSSLLQYQTVNQVLSVTGGRLLIAAMMSYSLPVGKESYSQRRLHWSAMSDGKRILFGAARLLAPWGRAG